MNIFTKLFKFSFPTIKQIKKVNLFYPKTLFLLMFFLSVQLSFGTNYYISSSTGDDENSGTSADSAWKTLKKIQYKPFAPGDSILLKKGDVWHETLYFKSSGISGNPIVYSSYGTGEKPIVSKGKDRVYNWTYLGNNIWSTTDLNYNPYRVVRDGKEINGAARDYPQEVGERIPDLVEWHYGGGKFIMYCADSPANHTITVYIGKALEMLNKHYINIENIRFVGGSFECVSILASSNINLKNLEIGENAYRGLWIGSYMISGGQETLSKKVIVDNCIIDSKYSFDYSQAGTKSSTSVRGPAEGVMFRGTDECELKNSVVRNYTHANINLFSAKGSTGDRPASNNVVKNCKIYNNVITSPDISYGGRMAIDGFCYDNEVYNNLFVDIAVQNQFGGFDNHIHHNIFKQIHSSKLKSYDCGYGVVMKGYYMGIHGNIVENNIMIDCENSGIYLSGRNYAGPVTNNTVRNNIIYNCGADAGDIGMMFTSNSQNYPNYANTVKNNVVFSDKTTKTVHYFDEEMTVAEFNAKNGTNEYIIGENLAADPMFVDVTNDDYHVKTGSPCINSGTTSLSIFDYEGHGIPQESVSDIGLYEKYPVGLEEYVETDNFSVYPNPTTKMLYINSFLDESIESISLFNLTGRQVYASSSNLNRFDNNTIDLSNIDNGVYILSLITKSHSYSRKIIKQ